MRSISLVLDSRSRTLLEAWSAEARPYEACGLLVGLRRGMRIHVARVERARNDASDPERYRVDPIDHLTIARAARHDGLDVVGAWHSHPAGVAVPSASDLESAWERFAYLIVAPGELEALELGAWWADDGALREMRIVSDTGRRAPEARPWARGRSFA